jgi:hypothetical protein
VKLIDNDGIDWVGAYGAGPAWDAWMGWGTPNGGKLAGVLR